MKSRHKILCRATPVPEREALLPQWDEIGRILRIRSALIGDCPKGINLDNAMIFDLREDDGLDGVEILHDFGKAFLPSGPSLRSGEKYWRLYLEVEGQESEFIPEITVNFRRQDFAVLCEFGQTEVDVKYLIGPGTTALVGQNELVGLSIDLGRKLKLVV